MAKKKNKQLNLVDLVNLWNSKSSGWLKKTKIISQLERDEKFMKEFKIASNDLPNIADWGIIIDEVLKNFEDDFWRERKGHHGLRWLFQRRSKGQGELNWVFYYEKGMDSLEESEQTKELFSFEQIKAEDLP